MQSSRWPGFKALPQRTVPVSNKRGLLSIFAGTPRRHLSCPFGCAPRQYPECAVDDQGHTARPLDVWPFANLKPSIGLRIEIAEAGKKIMYRIDDGNSETRLRDLASDCWKEAL